MACSRRPTDSSTLSRLNTDSMLRYHYGRIEYTRNRFSGEFKDDTNTINPSRRTLRSVIRRLYRDRGGDILSGLTRRIDTADQKCPSPPSRVRPPDFLSQRRRTIRYQGGRSGCTVANDRRVDYTNRPR